MDGYALGLIETRGLLAAIEAADVALKSANVALCGVENATGALITVKVAGDVGAVRAAVDAAKTRASLVGEVIATHILPRPASGIRSMIGAAAPASHVPAPETGDGAPHMITPPNAEGEGGQERETATPGVPEREDGDDAALARFPPETNEPAGIAEMEQAATCNLCADPVCSRRKGEPATLCIHRKKKRTK